MNTRLLSDIYEVYRVVRALGDLAWHLGYQIGKLHPSRK